MYACWSRLVWVLSSNATNVSMEATTLTESIYHADALPRWREIYRYRLPALIGGVVDHVTAADFLHHARYHRLCHLHACMHEVRTGPRQGMITQAVS